MSKQELRVVTVHAHNHVVHMYLVLSLLNCKFIIDVVMHFLKQNLMLICMLKSTSFGQCHIL